MSNNRNKRVFDDQLQTQNSEALAQEAENISVKKQRKITPDAVDTVDKSLWFTDTHFNDWAEQLKKDNENLLVLMHDFNQRQINSVNHYVKQTQKKQINVLFPFKDVSNPASLSHTAKLFLNVYKTFYLEQGLSIELAMVFYYASHFFVLCANLDQSSVDKSSIVLINNYLPKDTSLNIYQVIMNDIKSEMIAQFKNEGIWTFPSFNIIQTDLQKNQNDCGPIAQLVINHFYQHPDSLTESNLSLLLTESNILKIRQGIKSFHLSTITPELDYNEMVDKYFEKNPPLQNHVTNQLTDRVIQDFCSVKPDYQLTYVTRPKSAPVNWTIWRVDGNNQKFYALFSIEEVVNICKYKQVKYHFHQLLRAVDRRGVAIPRQKDALNKRRVIDVNEIDGEAIWDLFLRNTLITFKNLPNSNIVDKIKIKINVERIKAEKNVRSTQSVNAKKPKNDTTSKMNDFLKPAKPKKVMTKKKVTDKKISEDKKNTQVKIKTEKYELSLQNLPVMPVQKHVSLANELSEEKIELFKQANPDYICTYIYKPIGEESSRIIWCLKRNNNHFFVCLTRTETENICSGKSIQYGPYELLRTVDNAGNSLENLPVDAEERKIKEDEDVWELFRNKKAKTCNAISWGKLQLRKFEFSKNQKQVVSTTQIDETIILASDNSQIVRPNDNSVTTMNLRVPAIFRMIASNQNAKHNNIAKLNDEGTNSNTNNGDLTSKSDFSTFNSDPSGQYDMNFAMTPITENTPINKVVMEDFIGQVPCNDTNWFASNNEMDQPESSIDQTYRTKY